MPNVLDVAAYILAKQGPMTAMKLQKLVYYSQAWALVRTGEPLFPEPLEAWDGGPVSRILFARHRGMRELQPASLPGLMTLSPPQERAVGVVLAAYGHLDGDALSERTHAERPWLLARSKVAPGERATAVIEHGSMRDYYEEASAGPFVIQDAYFEGLDLLVTLPPEQLLEVHEIAADRSVNDYPLP